MELTRELAAIHAAQVLVMGSYGHGRAREWVLGGASRTVIDSMTLPVLILPAAWRGLLPQRLALGIGVLGLCGLGFWWLEPRALTFGDGLWLAFTTAATVGYGDIVPSTSASKIFAVFVVLMGLAVLSAVTASISALWVQTEERRIEHEVLQDLHRELQGIRDELAALRRERPSTKKAGSAATTHLG